MKYVLATNNKGKIAELSAIFEGTGISVISMSEAGVDCEPEENGSTFYENAVIKAKAACEASGLPAVADDSGLVIDALDGAPGVHTARFSEPGTRKKKVLDLLENVPDEKRTAAFVSCAVCCYPDGTVISAEGAVHGFITHEMRGTGGFGYDPIFHLPQFGKTMAEVTLEEKNSVSHRGIAFRKLVEKIISHNKENI